MKDILAICGSARQDSSNKQLLQNIADQYTQYEIEIYEGIHALPLFSADQDRYPWPPAVGSWRSAVQGSGALLIATPEYLHNIPASIKNAMEWLSSSGELQHKAVLPITFTPHPPRGEKAMQSLLWTLKTMQATVVATLPLYQNETEIQNGKMIFPEDMREMLAAALEMLAGG